MRDRAQAVPSILRTLAFALVASLPAACGDNATVPQERNAADGAASAPATEQVALIAAPPAPPPPPGARAPRRMSQDVASKVAGGAAGGQNASGGQPSADSAAPNMIIRTGTASVRVDSLEPAVASLRQMATALGGYVGNTSQSLGDDQVRSATLELKIPSARYDDAVAGLRPLGKVESVNSEAQDVGEEFVDVSARVANARRLEARLVELLATRAGKLEDVLAVERELARVREEIDRYEGRLRFLRSRVAMSTLTVVVHEPAPLVGGSPGDNVLGRALQDAWRNFVGFVAGFIAALGVLIPLGVLVAIALWIRRRWRRSRPTPGATG